MKKSYGRMIQEARRKLGLSVKEFLEIINKDVKPLTIADITKIEVHGKIPKFWTTYIIANALGLSSDELFEAIVEREERTQKESEEVYKEEGITIVCCERK